MNMGGNEHQSGRDGFATRAVHAGEAPDPTTGAHGTPLYQNATYAFHSFDQLTRWREGREPHFVYSRDSNPTVRVLEVKLANLEGAQTAVAAANGMAAIAATLLHLTRDGGHLIVSDELYNGTQDLLAHDLPAAGARVTSVNVRDLDALAAAIESDTRAILIEVVSNPSMRVADLDAVAALAQARGVTLVVDNTFLSPVLLRPLEHGANVVIHSATKYLSGHGQVLGGIVSGPGRVGRAGAGPVGAHRRHHDPVCGLDAAGRRQDPVAAGRATFGKCHASRPAVARPSGRRRGELPGLPDSPGHHTIRALVGDQFGGMLSFRLRDGVSRHRAFFTALRIPALAVSLGDCGSLIWPYSHSDLIRFSVGIEDPEDLEADLRQALDAAAL